MSNKAHLRPHRRERQANRLTRLLMVILIVVFFVLCIALAASGRGAPLARFSLLKPCGSWAGLVPRSTPPISPRVRRKAAGKA